eukprot:scaffold23039_cov163-Skeletonema_dohrnii-CCMP3373.AAC.1
MLDRTMPTLIVSGTSINFNVPQPLLLLRLRLRFEQNLKEEEGKERTRCDVTLYVLQGEQFFSGPATNKTFTYKLASKTNFAKRHQKMNKTSPQ